MFGWLWSKYFYKDYANHLLNSLKRHFAISTNWEELNYLGLTIDWNYSEEYVDISMTDYVRKALDKLQNPKPKIPQYALHRWSVPAYGKIIQMVPDPDESHILGKMATKRIQSIVGTMLYYERSVDSTMSWVVNEILPVQSRPTRYTARKERMLLDYAAT